MASYKGIGVMFARGLVRASSQATEEHLLAQLTPAERARYEAVVATDWVPIEFAARLFDLAAPLIYVGRSQPLRLLGKDMAANNLRGAYRFIARILTIPFLLEQSARLWRTYHQQGELRAEERPGKNVELIVEGYPNLPERFRECMCGWVTGAAEIAGAKSVIVSKSDDDPTAWRWHVRWR